LWLFSYGVAGDNEEVRRQYSSFCGIGREDDCGIGREDEMLLRTIAVWAMSAVLTLGAGMALAQQIDGPILLPKPKPQPKPAALRATLLVTCDLACNWKLDGEAKGRIEAGGSAKVKVEFGQHVVVAVTEDGADQVKQLSEVKSNGQTVVSIELQPVRDARVKAEQEVKDKAAREAKAEQEARDKAEREARDKTAREQQDKERQERERAAREEAARPTWTDPATGLMWTKKENDSDVNWQQAMDYCRNLQLAGYSDWRLPTIDELQGIYDANANSDGGWHIKGNLQISKSQWSSSQGNSSREKWSFYFSAWGSTNSGNRYSTRLGVSHYDARALCVRRSGE
jgi:hypothetical protein